MLFGNSDIVTDGTLTALDILPDDWFRKHAYAITRYSWNLGDNGVRSLTLSQTDSYDLFILIPRELGLTLDVCNRLDYYLGQLGAENRFCWELSQSFGVRWINPSLVVHTWHLHESGVRNTATWNNRVNTEGRSVHDLTPVASVWG